MPLPDNNSVLFQPDQSGFLYIKIEGNILTEDFFDADSITKFINVIQTPIAANKIDCWLVQDCANK